MTDQSTCGKCNQTLPFSSFYKDKSRPLGICRLCKECDNLLSKKRRLVKAGKTSFAPRVKLTEEDRIVAKMLQRAKERSLAKNITFKLTREDIEYTGICPVLGVKLEKGNGRHTAYSPSLDRINPSVGYVKGNVEVMSAIANSMKSNATPKQLMAFAKWVLKTYQEEDTIENNMY